MSSPATSPTSWYGTSHFSTMACTHTHTHTHTHTRARAIGWSQCLNEYGDVFHHTHTRSSMSGHTHVCLRANVQAEACARIFFMHYMHAIHAHIREHLCWTCSWKGSDFLLLLPAGQAQDHHATGHRARRTVGRHLYVSFCSYSLHLPEYIFTRTQSRTCTQTCQVWCTATYVNTRSTQIYKLTRVTVFNHLIYVYR